MMFSEKTTEQRGNPQEKLANILTFAGQLIRGSECSCGGGAVYTLVKVLADKISLDYGNAVIAAGAHWMDIQKRDNLFLDINSENAGDARINAVYRQIRKGLLNDVSVDIDLSKDPVIPLVSSPLGLVNKFIHIGTEERPWREDHNHCVDLWVPLGVSIVNEGNHSIFTGGIKRTGILKIAPGSNHMVYDISGLYNMIFFDGIYYKWMETSDIIAKAANFEFGCIFEIGRLMHNLGVHFKGVGVDNTKKEVCQ